MVQSISAIAEAVVTGAVLGSLADWLFAGILFHERYHRHSEIWREGVEGRRIVASQIFILLTSLMMVLLAAGLQQTDLRGATKLAVAMWLIAPVPMLATNYLFIKIDGLVTISHALGWLAKLLLIAGSAALFLR